MQQKEANIDETALNHDYDDNRFDKSNLKLS